MPKFETELHLSKEVQFADKLRYVWHMFDWIKASTFAVVDYYVIRKEDNTCVAFAEIKCRNCFYRTYRTVMISAKKIDHLITMETCCGYYKNENDFNLTPCVGLLFIRFLDGDFYYKVNRQDLRAHIAAGHIVRKKDKGRTKQTRCASDIEDVYYIDTRLFKQIDEMHIGRNNGVYKSAPEKTVKEITDEKEYTSKSK